MRGFKVDPDYTEDWPGRTTDSGVGKRSKAGLKFWKEERLINIEKFVNKAVIT